MDPAAANLTGLTALVPVATAMPSTGFSQSGEDLHAYMSYFYGLHDGIFVEMGALDGYVYSNTLFFETFLKWQGVLVEPTPHLYQKLVINRPNTVQVNAAVCNTSAVVHYVDVHNVDAVTPDDMSHNAINGIREFMSEEFRKRWAMVHDKGIVTEIPCVPLDKLLAELDLRHINFFSLDVEGAELSVLQTVDFRRVQLDVIVVEADGTDHVKDQQIVDLLGEHGYAFRGFLNRNNWFTRQDFVPSQQPSVA